LYESAINLQPNGDLVSFTRIGVAGKAFGGETPQMPLKSFSLLRFEDMVLFRDEILQIGTLPWLLAWHSKLLFPSWLFEGWKGERKTGREAWPAPLLMALLLLRHSKPGMTRLGAIREATVSAAWRAALHLPWHVAPPDEKTLREFEAFLKLSHPKVGRPRSEVAFEHWTRLGMDDCLASKEAIWVIDSTPMWCFGAVQDTVRLLGDGLRSLGKRWARARKEPLDKVAEAWAEPLLLAKSTKGYYEGTDWADPTSRACVLSRLAASVTQAAKWVTEHLNEVRENKHKTLLRMCRNLLGVVQDDLVTDEHGVLQIAHRATSARLISITDPEAQHFRKSKSKVCSGYKLHLLTDAVSGLVLSLSVTPGGKHDNSQAHPLIARAKALHADIRKVLGDAAYGGMPVRMEVRNLDQVEILAPPVASGRENVLGKKDFAINFEQMIATCPGGVDSSWMTLTKQGDYQIPTMHWAKGSAESCSCRDVCPIHDGRLRGLQLHPFEEELRKIRAEWEKPETRAEYRERSRGERQVREMIRRGARRACAWGLDNAQLQALMAGGVNNLLVLARHLARQIPKLKKAA
jgi:hypothetical protein